MGLMLSILVVCVGVVEALSCFEHFQYGVIHFATNVYERARKSSVLLKYTSERMKSLSENSFDEVLETETFKSVKFAHDSITGFERCKQLSETDYDHFNSLNKAKSIGNFTGPVKKLDNEDKIQIVKSLLEKPEIKPKIFQSISLPESTYSERDIELTKIINDLAIEPVDDIDIEIEDENCESLTKEFDKLFNEYENLPQHSESVLEEFNEDVNKNAVDCKHLEEIGFSESKSVDRFDKSTGKENDVKKCLQYSESDEILVKDKEHANEIKIEKVKPFKEVVKNDVAQRKSKKGADCFKVAISRRGSPHKKGSLRCDRSASVSLTVDLDVFPEMDNDSDGFVEKLILDESKYDDESVRIILESDTPPVELIDKTFQEIYEHVCGEPLDSNGEIESILNDEISLKTENVENDSSPFNCVSPNEIPSICTASRKISREAEGIKSGQSIGVLALPEVQDSMGALPSEMNFVHFTAEDNKSKQDHVAPVFLREASICTTPFEKTTSNTAFLKVVEQLAELIVKDALDLKKIKYLLCENNNIKEKLNLTDNDLGKIDIQHAKGQLESSPVATDLVFISECNVSNEHMKNLMEENVSQKILNDEYLNKENLKKSLLIAKEDRVNVPHDVVEQCQKDNLSPSDSEVPVVSNVEREKATSIQVKPGLKIFDKIISGKNLEETNILHEVTKQNEKDNFSLSYNEISKEGSRVDPEKHATTHIKPEEISKHLDKEFEILSKDSLVEETNRYNEIRRPTLAEEKFAEGVVIIILKDVLESGIPKTENIDETSLELEDVENKRIEDKIEIGKVCSEALDKTGRTATEVGDDKKNILTSKEKAANLEKNIYKKKDEPARVERDKMNLKKEIQSKQDIKTVRSDSYILSPNIQPDATKRGTLLAPEYTRGISSEGKEEEVEVDDEKAETSESVGIVETHVKIKERAFKFHKKVEECGDGVKFERVGEFEATEAAKLYAESKNVEKAGSESEKGSENGEKHSRDSELDSETKDTSSAPEAFWLIFSGEYTKAMSKDWHSGHFSCWQCDEALTGQRYVLRDDHPYCIKCYESVFANVCEECNKIIGIDSKDLSYKDKHWHEACFLCNKCRVSLVDKQFGSKADKIYCGNCYDAQFASRCDGCGEIFRAGTKKMEYKTRQWHEKCFCCCVCKTPIGTKSFIPREQEIYCATCYEEKFATRCVKCNKIITSGGVTYKNEPWHRECFTCTNCNTSLAGQRFTSRDEKPYCADCFGELFAKRCTACSRPITGIGGTRFISFEDRHWHNDCFICASCKTSLVGRGFITDGDDIICPECAKQKLM